MSQSRARRWRNPFVLGLLVGWLIGMLWWTGLVIAFGPSTVVTIEGGQTVERPITLLSRMKYAPVVAIPWAVAGLMIGCFAAVMRSRWVPVTACIGVVIGGIGAIADNPFDGWLTLVMPAYCLGGAFAGAMAGAVIAEVRRAQSGQIE